MAAQHASAGDYSTRYKFNGKELDQATGLYYYGARYYDPKISTWLSVDPLAEKYQLYSPYNYTLNNPINLIDPDGRHVDWHKNKKGSDTADKGDSASTYAKFKGISFEEANKVIQFLYGKNRVVNGKEYSNIHEGYVVDYEPAVPGSGVGAHYVIPNDSTIKEVSHKGEYPHEILGVQDYRHSSGAWELNIQYTHKMPNSFQAYTGGFSLISTSESLGGYGNLGFGYATSSGLSVSFNALHPTVANKIINNDIKGSEVTISGSLPIFPEVSIGGNLLKSKTYIGVGGSLSPSCIPSASILYTNTFHLIDFKTYKQTK